MTCQISSKGCIIILIDSREQNAPYLIKRFGAAGIDSEIVCFPQSTSCDYLIANHQGTCAIQRKVVCSELLNELDEIMHDIVPNLAAFSDNPCLLVEENFDITKDGYLQDHNSGRHTEMKAIAYYNYLETVRKMGLDVYCTRNLNESVWWMIAMHNYLEKHHYPKHRKFFGIEEQAMGMLMCVPGIGEVRAKKALAENSIAGMVGIDKVGGLTEAMSKRLEKVLNWRNAE